MGDTIKMPGGGFDIKVVRKEDIIQCIDDNIVDKDIMLAFIEQLEVDIATFLSQGRWTTLPYMGTLRINAYKQIMKSEETKQLISDAKETLDKDKYVLFRRTLSIETSKSIKYERIYRYITSQVARKNMKFYNNLAKNYNETVARFICYTMNQMDKV